MTVDFYQIMRRWSWEEVGEMITSRTQADVELALKRKGKKSVHDFMALISPAAEDYVSQLAEISHRISIRRFGKIMKMFIPVYLSNECQNICTYCGFSLDNKIPRTTLSESQMEEEIKAIKAMGYEHVLLVTGEANQTVGVDYFEKAISKFSQHFAHVSMEVQPMDEGDYSRLISKGLNAVLVYQETYREETYKEHHPKGKKSNFYYRLGTPERLGRAGIHKIGLGCLLGLEDWRIDSFFTALHLDYLQKKFWKSSYAISFPRLRPCVGGLNLKSNISDKQLVQLIAAWRIFNEDVELSLSTREEAKFRDAILPLGITSMSAGSKTDPGGYSAVKNALEQFEISDERSVDEVRDVLTSKGYEVVWKDWDRIMN